MKKSLVAVFLLACSILIPSLAAAVPIRAYVAEFSVTPPEAAGLKKTLQTLLSSRLASESVVPVANASEADVIILGSYTQIGKIFSLDAVAKLGSARTLATVFEQGESQDDLIPALGRISAKLKTGLQGYQPAPAASSTVIQQAPAASSAVILPAPATSSAVILPAPAVVAPTAAAPLMQQAAGANDLGTTAWVSQRIKNAQMGLALAANRPEGQEFFLAESHALRVYRQEKNLKLLAEVTLPLREKVISVDSTGPDQNGNPRVFVTAIDGENPASRIYSFEGGQLKLVASKIPYMFRAIALNGGASKMYAQEMSTSEDFYGDLYEITETGGVIEKKNAIKMPRYGNVYNYATVAGPDGKSYPVVYSPDGYLVVYSAQGEEIWRSSEKFGGSETFFQRDNSSNARDINERVRWRFLDQRIVVTKDGQLVVPQNAGFFVIGNNRSYSKYSLVSFTWTGASLEERWRTKQNQNYLADFFYKPASRELVLLEVVQKEGVFTSGGSTVRVLRAD